MSVTSATPSPLDVITNVMVGFTYSKALTEVCILGIPDLLQKYGPQTAEQLVELMSDPGYEILSHVPGVPLPHYLHRTLRAVSHKGIFDEVKGPSGEMTFALNSNSELLCSDHPLTTRWWNAFVPGAPSFDMWAYYSEIIRTGKNGCELAGQYANTFDWYHAVPNEEVVFQKAMRGSMAVTLSSLKKQFEFSHFSKIVDVGGSYGHVLKAMLETSSQTKGVNFDLPRIAEHAKEVNVDDKILGDPSRVEYVGGNFLESVPEADCYVISRVLHDWNDDDSTTILKNCADSLQGDDGRVYILDVVMPKFGAERFEFSRLPFFYDLHMMVLFQACERTAEVFSSLFSKAGLELVSVTPLEISELSVIEARKKL